MSERDGYIPGVPCWVDTSQPNPEAVLGFYSGLFGWEFEDMMPPDAPARYVIAQPPQAAIAVEGSDEKFPTRLPRIQQQALLRTTRVFEKQCNVWRRTTEKFFAEFLHSLEGLESRSSR